VIGTVLDGWQLYPDWEEVTSREIISLEDAVNHMDHICQLAGNARHVGLGTDLDGGFGTEQVPAGLDTIADLQEFPDLLRARGYEEADVAAIMYGNWLRLLREALPAR
jgi:membrane dipeptidase